MPRPITPATSLVTLKKEAKRWLKQLREQDSDARLRLERIYPTAPEVPVLRDVQHALAMEHGQDNWIALKAALQNPPVEDAAATLTADAYERLADDLVMAFDSQDQGALDRLNAHYHRSFSFDDLWAEIWRRVYAFRERSSRVPKNYLRRDEAQMVIAQDAGFGSWAALTQAAATGAPRVPAFAIDATDNQITPRRHLSDAEWDTLVGIMRERRVTRLDAGGLMTDAVLARIATLDHVTVLSLGGSRELSDECSTWPACRSCRT